MRATNSRSTAFAWRARRGSMPAHGPEKARDAAARAGVKPSAVPDNGARARGGDEARRVEAPGKGQTAGAGIDVTVEEPRAPTSPLGRRESAFITPHTAGETRR